MDRDDAQKRISEEEDYIRAPKFGNSLARFMAVNKNSDGVDNETIARVLMISEDEVEKLHQEAIELLRKEMVDESNS